MVNQKRKNILAIAGIISTIVGIAVSIPSFLKEQYLLATISVVLMVAGLILLAISFGD